VLTVTPTPPPPFGIQGLLVSPSTFAASGTATGTSTTTVAAPPGGQVIKLSTSDSKLVSLPASVTVPAGATTATFPVNVTSQSGTVAVGVSAVYQNRGPSAVLIIGKGTVLTDAKTGQRLATESARNPDPEELGFYGAER
jgi:hypothetical protein